MSNLDKLLLEIFDESTPISLEDFLKPHTVSIAIFGSRGAGKTTLWKQLMGVFKDADYYHPTLGAEDINLFSIEYDGKKKYISTSKDFGGDDNLVKEYGEIISENTFVYYLIDLTTLEEFKNQTRARLQYLSKLIEQKQLKDEVRLCLVATHYLEYLSKNPEKTHSEAIYELANIIGLKDIRGVKIGERIMVAELTKKEDIQQFFEQIVLGS